ncbi:MAG TPA: hypothetical protein VFV70_01515 [Hyphomonadaceae bacterium]|nr:hypothetical protein [Hyphomonadaceae bacterium]
MQVTSDGPSAAIELPETETRGTDAIQQAPIPIGTTGGGESESTLPRLADSLGQLGAAPGGDVPASEYSQPATDADVQSFAKQLRDGSKEARLHLSSQASKACAALDRDRTKADGLVEAEKTRADGVVHKALEKRRSDLELTLAATLASINWQEGIRKKEAEDHGVDARLEMAWTVSRQRGRMERAVERWVGYIDTLRDFHIDRIKTETAQNIPQTTAYAEMYERTFLQTGRESAGRVKVQRDAAFAFAKGLADEFRKIEPEAIRLTRETTAEMAGKVYEYANNSYNEFDKNLPQLLNAIDDQVASAKENIGQKARHARAKLATAATKARDRLKDIETSWYARNSSVETQVKGKIKTVRDDTERGYRRSVPRAMGPISTIVNEAIDVIDSGDALDVRASSLFVDEITGFASDAAVGAGELFASTSEGISESFKRPGPSARRSLTAEAKNYRSILQEEGAGQEFALIEFESAVDASYAASITTLDGTFAGARVETKKGLSPYVDEFLAVLEDTVMKAAKELRRAVDEPLFKQSGALERLRKREMGNVVRQAAWRYDHSILKHVSDALDWIAEKVAILFVAITIILAVIVLFKLAVGALAFFVGATVAKFIVSIGVAYLLISQGVTEYKKRIDEGASPVGAFFGALGEVTGVLPVYRALTDSSLSITDRGVQLGFGALALFGTAMAAGKLFKAIRMRFPARLTDPRISAVAEPLPPPSQIVVQPKPEFTVRGFMSHKAPPEPTPLQSPATTSPSTGGYARASGERVPIAPETPPKPEFTVRGFLSHKAPPEPTPLQSPATTSPSTGGSGRVAGERVPITPEAPPKPEFTVRGFLSHKPPPEPAPLQSPATTSPSTGGYARLPGERVPIAPKAPPAKVAGSQPNAPREVPSPTTNVQGAQGTRAGGSVSTSSPRGSQPVKGKAEVATQQAEAPTTSAANVEAVKPSSPVARASSTPPRRTWFGNRALRNLYLSVRMAINDVIPSHSDIAGGRIGKTPSASVVPKAPVEGRPVIIDPANAPTPRVAEPAPGSAAVTTAPKPAPRATTISEAAKPPPSTAEVPATPRTDPAPTTGRVPGNTQTAVPAPEPPMPGAQGAPAKIGLPETSRTVEPVKEQVQPVSGAKPVAPESAPLQAPQTPRKSRIMEEADARVQEVRDIETRATERSEQAAKNLAAAEEELAIAKSLRKTGEGDRKIADEFVAEQNKRVRDAKKENKDATNALEKARTESEEVAATRERIQQLENEIAELEAAMQKAAQDTSTQFRPVKNIRPPRATPAGREYTLKAGDAGRGKQTLAARRADLYRTLAEHVRRLTPGEKGKPMALENARKLGEQFPEIAPEGDVPIDVMTAKPINGEWATDHLMSRSEIASDPRFKLLDPAGRVEMMQNIPENYLPLTGAANSSKLNRTVAEWLAALGRNGTEIDPNIAKALRKADELARAAVEEKFQELLRAMGK